MLWYFYVPWLPLVCNKLSQMLSTCWIHGLVLVQIDATNLYDHPNEQYSHGCDSLIGVLFLGILHFVYIALLIFPH